MDSANTPVSAIFANRISASLADHDLSSFADHDLSSFADRKSMILTRQHLMVFAGLVLLILPDLYGRTCPARAPTTSVPVTLLVPPASGQDALYHPDTNISPDGRADPPIHSSSGAASPNSTLNHKALLLRTATREWMK